MTVRCRTAVTSSSHCRHDAGAVIGRAFKVDNDPAAGDESSATGSRSIPIQPGAVGTAVASFLSGAALRARDRYPETRFVDASTAINTIPPATTSYWELIDEVVQQEPAEAGTPSSSACSQRWESSRQTVPARRADAQDPQRRGRGGQCHCPHRHLCTATRGRLGLLPRFGVVQRDYRRWIPIPGSAT